MGKPWTDERRKAFLGSVIRRYKDPESRFRAMVDTSGGPDACWPWKGGTPARKRDPRAYVKMAWHGGKEMYVHRIAVLLDGRPAGPDQVVDHMCKHVRCCNPRHLRVCTQEENVGPYSKGTPHWINKNKTHCMRGHPFAGANLGVKWMYPRRSGAYPYLMRICLTCHPRWWQYAVIERSPPGARSKWRGPPKEYVG